MELQYSIIIDRARVARCRNLSGMGSNVSAVTVQLLQGDLPDELARALRRAGTVAIDTETSGLDWRVDQLHMCQLFAPATGPILVREVAGRPSGLASVLEDPAVLKVLHFAPFDLRFLEAHWGIQARSVACTKTASRLVDPAADRHSLKALLERYLGILIDKGMVRTSDWSAPVLSDVQLSYAVADVSHLLDLYQLLVEQLKAAGAIATFEQVCAYVPIDAHLEVAGYPNPLQY